MAPGDCVTSRLRARVERDFGENAVYVIDALEAHEPPLSDLQSRERLLAAIVLLAEGDVERFEYAIGVSNRDWRDTLVASGLGNGDWPERLSAELGD